MPAPEVLIPVILTTSVVALVNDSVLVFNVTVVPVVEEIPISAPVTVPVPVAVCDTVITLLFADNNVEPLDPSAIPVVGDDNAPVVSD